MASPLSDAGCTLRPTHRFSVSRSSVTPLGRPSTTQSSMPLRPPPASGRSTQRHEGRTMFSMPLAYPSTLDRRPASYVEELWSPEPRAPAGKSQAKAHAYSPARFPAQSAEGLSLSGGASIRSRAFSS